MADERKNPLVLALEARLAERPTFEFDATSFMGPGQKPLGKVRLRVATKAEQDRAVIAAHRYAEEIGKGGTAAISDDDILRDAKTAFILHDVCRQADDPKYPAFLGPKWMMDHLSVDEIGVLLNHYNEVLAKSGPVVSDFSDATVDALASVLAEHAGNNLPDYTLARYTRAQLADLCVLLALKLSTARAEADAPAEPVAVGGEEAAAT